MTFLRLRDDKSDYDLYETPPVDFIPDSDIGFYATQYDANDLATCYANGFFPWPSPSHPVIPFYCPRKRFVLRPADLHVSHSLRRTIAKRTFTIHCDTAFCDVISNAPPPPDATKPAPGSPTTTSTLSATYTIAALHTPSKPTTTMAHSAADSTALVWAEFSAANRCSPEFPTVQRSLLCILFNARAISASNSSTAKTTRQT